MGNILAALAIIALAGSAAPTLAQDGAGNVAAAVLAEETVSAADLGVAEPTLLPSSPFYFFKNFGRAIQRTFTFNPVRKIELELRHADEKIAEAKKLAETAPERTDAVARAVENYRTSSERLKARLETLAETSQNQNVDRLLEKLVDRTIKHEKLFAELGKKFEEKPELVEKLKTTAERIGETAAAAAQKDDPEKFARKLEKALVEAKGSDLKHIRSIEILDRIHQKADERLKEKLTDIREDFALRLAEDLEEFAKKHDATARGVIRDTLEGLPGDRARRLIIIEELKARASGRVGAALEQAGEALEKAAQEREDPAAHAAEAIRHAEERLVKLEAALKAAATVPSAVETHARQARTHLERATRALEDKKYGEAFGQARSAEVQARSALRILGQERPEAEELKEDIAELEEKLLTREGRLTQLGLEFQPKAKEALESSRFHLRLASETLNQNQPRELKRHLEEAKEALRLLERIFHQSRKSEAKPAREPAPEAARCPALTFPACEEDNTSDACRLQVREAAAKYPRCGFEKIPAQERPRERTEEKPRQPPAARPAQERELVCAQEFNPVCGEDGKTYSNACVAKVAGMAVKHRGECSEPKPEVKVEPPSTSSGQAPPPAAPPPPKAAEDTAPPPATAIKPAAFKLEADDLGFYPSNVLKVPKGTRVHLTFVVRETNVYYGGLDFRSSKFKTPSVKPGGNTSVEFTADEPFVITSYWPLLDARKAELKIEVQ